MPIRVSPYGFGPEYAWVLDCNIHDLEGHWLVVECNNYPCRKGGGWPFTLLGEHFNKALTLSFILGKLRCSNCGAKPVKATLRQTITNNKDGTPQGWGLTVYPDLKIPEEFREPCLILPDPQSRM